MIELEENSFYIETYGCTSNKADSYIISQVLTNSKYTQTNIDDARFIIINTCAVKQQTENKIRQRLHELHESRVFNPNKHVLIGGCMPHITPNYIKIIKDIIPSFSAIIDLNNIHEIPDIIEKVKEGKKNLIFLSEKSIDKAEILIDHHPEKITGILPISEGCLGACTYCCVKNARGTLRCYDPEKIIENVRYQLKQGIKQIYLTSQDCSTYENNDIKLADLVRSIVELDYDFFLRIGMINPRFLVEDFQQIISIFELEKVYQFLHVPIQSGSDDILREMERKYIISEIKDKLATLRQQFPDLTISTDVICGFPGETEEDFKKTLDFIRFLNPEILNISKFTPRPGTKAKEMIEISSKKIKERSIQLSNIFRNSLANINQKWEGWKGKVLILHKGSYANQAFGRNYAYKNIFIEDYIGEYGKFVNVQIEKIDGYNLFGKKKK